MTRGSGAIAAGLLPLPWFLAWITLGGLLAPGYDPIARHASELGLLPGAPRLCEQVAALGSGAATIIFAIGLWQSAGRRVAGGVVAWILFGAAMLSNAAWTMGDPRHGLYGIGIANIVAPALSLAGSARLRRARGLHGLTLAVTIADLFYLWLNLTGRDPAALRGLTQRVFSSASSAWPGFVAWRLFRSGGPATGVTRRRARVAGTRPG